MRQEFKKPVKVAAWKRANGHCEKCTAKLYPGKYEYHHDKECTFGGDNSLENCVVLCVPCHDLITGARAKDVAKSNAVRNKHAGIKRKPKGRPLPGTKASGWKRKMDGTLVRR